MFHVGARSHPGLGAIDSAAIRAQVLEAFSGSAP